MQNKEWNNVFDGNSAKWAEINKEFITDDKVKEKELVREEIAKNETEIPEANRKEMDKFIKDMQEKGLSKRNIRRAFERKFNVKII